MATTNILTALGAADIDTKELMTNLVAATKEPRQKLLDAEKTKANIAISSIALMKSGLVALQDAATEIASASKLKRVTTVTSNPEIVSVSASNTAVAKAGSYSLTVTSLAAPRRLKAEFAEGFTTTTEVNLTLAIPGVLVPLEASSISIGVGKSPADIVSSVNSWIKSNAANSGASAVLIDSGTGSTPLTIVIEGASGTSNDVSISIDPSPSEEIAFSELSPSADAVFTLNGLTVTRSSNKVSDVVSGLDLQLKSISATPITVDAKPDASAIVENIKNFVEVFNTVGAFLKKAVGPKVEGDEQAGALQGNSSARMLMSQLRAAASAVYGEKPSSITTLNDLGIEFDRFGVMRFENESKFVSAYESKAEDVIKCLSNNAPSPYLTSKARSGLMGDIAILAYQSSSVDGGSIATMSSGYELMRDRLETKQNALDAYVARLTENYERQFTALNSALASFKSTSAQLEKALDFNNKN